MLHNKNNQGMSLIDVILGIALMMIVFVGIFGAFQLSLELVGNSKSKIGALALGNEQMEFIRSLAYDDVGTVGGIPDGDILQNEEIILNGVTYNRRTFIQYVDDPMDGLGESDTNSITTDYKLVKVELSWMLRERPGSIALVSNIVPKGIESTVGGGTIRINVVDAFDIPLQGAEVNIVNTSVAPSVNVSTFSGIDGAILLPGAESVSDYEITVTKSGYSTAQTYTVSETNTDPNPRHLTVTEDETTSSTFAIDTLGSLTIRTFEPIRDATFFDTFSDEINIASTNNVLISGGGVELIATTTGTVTSNTISPIYLVSWEEFSWNDTTPAGTSVMYQLYSGGSLIPNLSLPSNSTGLTSPVDLSSLNASTYDELSLVATLTTTNDSSPTVLDWTLDYTEGPIPLPNISFSMRGDKIIGEFEDSENPIYKYEETNQTNGSGTVLVSNLEWDTYRTGILGGYNIYESCQPQPVALDPSESETVDVIVVPETTHSLLVSVRNDSGVLLEGATVRLYRTGYDVSQNTSLCGQSYFSGLTENTYSADVTLSGYTDNVSFVIDVNGESSGIIILDAI